MKLRELIQPGDPNIIKLKLDPESEISGITDDSRQAQPGILFCATAQSKDFVQNAIERGAFLVSEPAVSGIEAAGSIVVRDVPSFMGETASVFYGRPSESIEIVAVTGTNGKTSTAWMIYHLWKRSGIPAGLIGTLGVRFMTLSGEQEEKTGYTTPRSYQLQELLAKMRDAGVQRVAMEASSEALALGRLRGTRFSVAAFTNLTRDHLDYHGTMQNYFDAKAMLLRETAARNGRLIVFITGEESSETRGYAERMMNLATSLSANTTILTEPLSVDLPADFQKMNAAIALEAAGFSPGERDKFESLFREIPHVPGRFEPVSLSSVAQNAQSFAVVDYAHSPDALEAVLMEARRSAEYVITVCGCGGNRDPGKRPLMGSVASRLSDVLIVTDDNPRKENPAEIRRQMRAGANGGATLIEIGDRRDAIREAIRLTSITPRKCIVVVAGKGHESIQILQDRIEPFSDREEIEKSIAVIK